MAQRKGSSEENAQFWGSQRPREQRRWSGARQHQTQWSDCSGHTQNTSVSPQRTTDGTLARVAVPAGSDLPGSDHKEHCSRAMTRGLALARGLHALTAQAQCFHYRLLTAAIPTVATDFESP